MSRPDNVIRLAPPPRPLPAPMGPHDVVTARGNAAYRDLERRVRELESVHGAGCLHFALVRLVCDEIRDARLPAKDRRKLLRTVLRKMLSV